MARESYDHARIELAAQEKWEELGLYTADLTDETKDKYYLLFEFPYPSGDLHIGHWYAFALTDIYARKLRMEGKNVLFPVGFDAFGLPAENAAIKHGLDSKEWTYQNMDTMRAQMKRMGTSVDWSKEVVSCDPAYYKWTQWIFTTFFEHELAERKEAFVKWCPKDKTVLANEQVTDGLCERCGAEVEERSLTQWFIKITDYAERLIADLDTLDWPNEIKEAQRAWIGKSEGARLRFPLHTGETDVPLHADVFTTRPDTVFGATYLVLAPEHPLVDTLVQTAGNPDAIRAYQRETARKTERERSESKKKTGVILEGVMATNPATKLEIPVYLADYVIASYGTGAVMAVPAHDERDFAFAQEHNLPITHVIEPRYVDTLNPHIPGKEIVERNGILAIVRNPKDMTYLCLKWKHAQWLTFITGGREDGEDGSAAARREVAEETGYNDLRLISHIGNTRSEFFASHKDLNRIGHSETYLFELVSDARVPVENEEIKKHEFLWLTEEEMKAKGLRHAEFDFLWNQVKNGAQAYTGDGYLIHSGEFDGRENREAFDDIITYAGGEKVNNYRLRDWSVGRQRYWGCPIPMVYDPEGRPHAVPKEHLPWLLPTDVSLGENTDDVSPLAQSKELKERVIRIFGEGWTPEYDTLDTFVDSSWYFMRYLAPHSEDDFSEQALLRRWMPVDRYSGGSEHTTMHLLYARFVTKALYDLALAPVSEPFVERFNRGIILGPDGGKMSKSKGNVINPDEIVEKYGSDAVRMYLAFIGPYNEPGHYPWNLDGTFSMRKFLDRVAVLKKKVTKVEDDGLSRAIAEAIMKVGTDIDRFKFNTAISAIMVLVRDMERAETISSHSYIVLLVLLAPFAPHLAEHLFEEMGEEGSVHQLPWPAADAGLLVQSTLTIGVQVSGKRRGEITIARDAPESVALAAALSDEAIRKWVGGEHPSRVVYVPGKLISIVP